MSHFDPSLAAVTPPVLYSLADNVEAFASQLRRVANNNELRLEQRRQNSRRRSNIKTASIAFLKLVDSGVDTETALQTVTDQYCVDAKTISMTAGIYRAKISRIEKIELDRRIMKLWRAGHKCQDIADQVGRNRQTVHRVIREFRAI